jgi:hypothetical protein
VNKLPYEYVTREVDKLYEKEFDESDVGGIDAHCAFIVKFINACGWTEEEYIRAMFGFVPLESGLN